MNRNGVHKSIRGRHLYVIIGVCVMLLLTSDTLTACKPSVKINITVEKDLFCSNEMAAFFMVVNSSSPPKIYFLSQYSGECR